MCVTNVRGEGWREGKVPSIMLLSSSNYISLPLPTPVKCHLCARLKARAAWKCEALTIRSLLRNKARIFCSSHVCLLVAMALIVDDSLSECSCFACPYSIGHCFPLSCSCPIDFEFQVYCIEPHKAFSIQPLSGNSASHSWGCEVRDFEVT